MRLNIARDLVKQLTGQRTVSKQITSLQWVDTWAHDMVIGYWSVAILFWQLSIDHIDNVLYKRWGLAKTTPVTPLPSFWQSPLPHPYNMLTRTYVRTLGQSRDNQTKRGWPYSMSMGLCPTRASRARKPRYKIGEWTENNKALLSFFGKETVQTQFSGSI